MTNLRLRRRASPLWLPFVILACVMGSPAAGFATTLHVDGTRGSDDNDGVAAPFKTIQRAADRVEPGDEVVIHPGVYYERIRLRKKSDSWEKPIVFRADQLGRNRVIITSANRRIREKLSSWQLEDAQLALYSTPYFGPIPSRVLYSGTDLFPYGELTELRDFATASGSAPRHGYHYERTQNKLYVRLHDSGRFGPTDPGLHAMAVSPREGFNFSLLVKGNAHVILDGITFEAAGHSAILTRSSSVKILRCWFVACPYAVSGTREKLVPEGGQDDTAANVTIAWCDFSESAVFDDVEEILERANLSPKRRGTWAHVWHRKTTGRLGLPKQQRNYENGIAAKMGDDWSIHHNYIHDAFEGLASDGVTRSRGLKVHDNVFARIGDNGVEVENHSRDVDIYRNVFVDVLEPFSYQPIGGTPWPGPVYFHQNIIINNPRRAELWRHALPNGRRGVFKVGISLKNWERGHTTVPRAPLNLPPPGLLIFNNTVHFPGGRLITPLGNPRVPLETVLFANNFFLTDMPIRDLSPTSAHLHRPQFANNQVVAFPGSISGEETRIVAGSDDTVLEQDPIGSITADNVEVAGRLAVPGTSVPVADAPVQLPHVGALAPRQTWFPPKVGPLATNVLDRLGDLP